MDRIFAFSYARGLSGASVSSESKEEFDEFFQELDDELDELEGAFPTRWPIFSYFFERKTQAFAEWSTIVPEFKYDPEAPFSQILVPTADTVCHSFIMEQLLRISKPVLFDRRHRHRQVFHHSAASQIIEAYGGGKRWQSWIVTD